MLELGSIFERKNTTEMSNRMTSYTNPQGTTEFNKRTQIKTPNSQALWPHHRPPIYSLHPIIIEKPTFYTNFKKLSNLTWFPNWFL